VLKNKPQTYSNFQCKRPHHTFLLVEKQPNVFCLLSKEKSGQTSPFSKQKLSLVKNKQNNKVSLIIYINFSLKMNFVTKCFLVLLHSDLLHQRWTVETKIC